MSRLSLLIVLESSSMLPPSPLDYLIAFALAFLAGVLVAGCHCKYVGKIRREATHA